MRTTPTIGLAVAAVTLAGCAAASADTDTAASPTATTSMVTNDAGTTPATRTATPTATTPVALSAEEAAKRYLEIVRPYNEALERLEQAINGGESLQAQTALAAVTADKLRNEIEQLRDTAWPAEVGTHVHQLVTVSEQALQQWSEAAAAQTQDELIQAVLAAGEFDGTEAATAIRELLDLDAYDEGDYD